MAPCHRFARWLSHFSGNRLLHVPLNLVRYSFGTTGRYRLWTMHILKRLFGRVDGPLLHGLLAGCVIMVISSLGLFYLAHSAREAQLDAVRTELQQLARVAATLVDG